MTDTGSVSVFGSASGDVVQALLNHNGWANRNLIEACSPLSDEQLDHLFEMGLGSLRVTITHVLGAMRSWADVIAERPQRPWLGDEAPKGVAEWRELLEPITADFRDSAVMGSLDDVIRRERDGKVFEFVRGHVIAHVTTHGVHHRAQCLNMLRRLGQPEVGGDLPPSSVVEWMRTLPNAVTENTNN